MIIAKYKFNNTIANCIPVFNDGYSGYTYTDVVEENITTRTIECDTLPTRIGFGYNTTSFTVTRIVAGSLLEVLDINVNTTNTNYMFSNCDNLTSLDVSGFDTSNVTDMSWMFYNCTNLTSLDVSNWNTSNVTNMRNMFQYCNNLTSLDVSNWNTSKVTDMRGMFNGCHKLTSLDVSNWDTSNVTDMCGMFFRCNALTMLDLTNIDAQKAKTDYMCDFLSNDNLKILVLGNKSIHSDINSYGSMLNEESGENPFPLLEKLICPNADYINKISEYLPDRSSEVNSGIIVTNATISDETINTVSSKNWSIRKMVVQYRFDANTYEDLIPEFNTEFSSDKYEIYDSVSEIVIDDIQWVSLPSNNYPNNVRSNYIPVLSNITYNFNCNYVNVQWLDKDKKEILNNQMGGNNPESYVQKYLKSPINAKYLRVSRGEGQTNITISAKLITRSIESVNGDLPTLMRFGEVQDNASDKQYSLLKVLDINLSEVTTMDKLFTWCKNLTEINSNSTTSKVTSMYVAFGRCEKLTKLNIPNITTNLVTNMQGVFTDCHNLTSLDVSNWDTSNVNNMFCMFYSCNKLTSIGDISNWDTSNVTTMQSMFSGCNNLTSLDVSSFNTNKVTSMLSMFSGCNNLTSLDVSNFNTNNVTNMQSMFYNCNNLTSLDLSNWNTSKVTDMLGMFSNCSKLTTLDVSNFNTSEVTTMNSMFYNCYSLTTLDVSNFNTSEVTTMYQMFAYCTKLTSLDVSNWDTSNVTSMREMFYDCNKLTTLDVSNWDTSNVTNIYRMFRECRALSNLDLSRWNPSAIIGDLFVNANSLKSIRMSNFKQAKEGIFVWYSCETLEYIDINKMNITQVLEGMFGSQSIKCIRCNVKTSIPFIAEMILDRTNLEQGKIITNVEVSSETISTLQSKNWTVVSSDTLTKVAEYVYDSNTWNSMIPTFNDEFVEYFIDDVEDENGLVTRTISSMGENLPTMARFGHSTTTSNKQNCLVGLKYLNTGNIENMHCMLGPCKNLLYVNTEGWDTSKVTNMSGVFSGCSKLTSIDVSNFNTKNVTNMSYMFNSCSNLTSLDLSNWDTSNATNMYNMFSYTSLLTDIGMLYCSSSTINTISSNLPTTHTQTIWVQDTKPNECTVVSGVEFKEYKDNNVMINLNSPLLQGDRIEVKDGKLCHYHKMGSVVLDGSEDEEWINHIFETVSSSKDDVFSYKTKNTILDKMPKGGWDTIKCMCDTIKPTAMMANIYYRKEPNFLAIMLSSTMINSGENGCIIISSNISDVSNFKQWLQENPTTVIYELAEPYYEDITPLQSKLTLETYLECNMNIYTNLPIKTNLTYLTNITNTSSIEEEINTINEGTDLTNLLEDEINN